jgi:hypothetical protein
VVTRKNEEIKKMKKPYVNKESEKRINKTGAKKQW